MRESTVPCPCTHSGLAQVCLVAGVEAAFLCECLLQATWLLLPAHVHVPASTCPTAVCVYVCVGIILPPSPCPSLSCCKSRPLGLLNQEKGCGNPLLSFFPHGLQRLCQVTIDPGVLAPVPSARVQGSVWVSTGRGVLVWRGVFPVTPACLFLQCGAFHATFIQVNFL